MKSGDQTVSLFCSALLIVLTVKEAKGKVVIKLCDIVDTAYHSV